MSKESDKINHFVTQFMQENDLEDTDENRLEVLKEAHEVVKATGDGFDVALYRIAFTGEIMKLETRLMFKNVI